MRQETLFTEKFCSIYLSNLVYPVPVNCVHADRSSYLYIDNEATFAAANILYRRCIYEQSNLLR